MFSAFINSFKIPDLRKKIIFTMGLIFICRVVTSVPTPGVDAYALRMVIRDIANQVGGGFLGWADLFSGGALSHCAIGALSIWPYISASIILQLMTAIFPFLERLAREGESGRQKLNQYTRYLTVVICCIQAFVLAQGLKNPSSMGLPREVVTWEGWGFYPMTMITMTTGTMLLMWLGEQISERGIGNGISIVIMVNIVSRLPEAFIAAKNMFTSTTVGTSQYNIFHLILLITMIFLVTAGTIALTQGQRTVSYTHLTLPTIYSV